MDDVMNCPICNSKALFKFISNLNKRIYQCASVKCCHLFVEEYEKRSGICERCDNVSERRLKLDRDDRLSTYDERNRRMFTIMFDKLRLKNKAYVLDFGSGDGHLMSSLRGVYPNVDITCVEPNSVFEPLIREVSDNIVFSLDDLERKFDLIVLNEVVEHLNYPVDILKKLSRLLKNDNSGMYIATPLGETHLNSNLTGAYTTDSHLHFFTRNSLNMCLLKSGLTSLDVEDVNYPIYNLCLEQKLKGRVKYFVRKVLVDHFLKLSKKNCILPSAHVSGLCYKL